MGITARLPHLSREALWSAAATLPLLGRESRSGDLALPLSGHESRSRDLAVYFRDQSTKAAAGAAALQSALRARNDDDSP
jgi:hypothetical protein